MATFIISAEVPWIGVFIAMEEVFRLVFGPYALDFPAKVPLPTVHVGGTVVTGVQLLTLIFGLVVLVGAVADTLLPNRITAVEVDV